MTGSQPTNLADDTVDSSRHSAQPPPGALGDVDPQAAAEAAWAGIDTSQVQVLYTDGLPDGVFVVYRGNPPRLLISESWWRVARPVERIQALENLWARLKSLPPEAWDVRAAL
jgi:hypothetical protein